MKKKLAKKEDEGILMFLALHSLHSFFWTAERFDFTLRILGKDV